MVRPMMGSPIPWLQGYSSAEPKNRASVLLPEELSDVTDEKVIAYYKPERSDTREELKAQKKKEDSKGEYTKIELFQVGTKKQHMMSTDKYTRS